MAIETLQMTVEQYLALEAESEIRHEYIDGEIFPYDGRHIESRHRYHELANCGALFPQLIGSDCRLHTSHMRVGLSPTRYLYPDLSAVCGEAETDDMAQPLCSIPFSWLR